MRIDPAIAEWRRDGAAQRSAQRDLESARQAWRDGAARTLLADLDRYGAGEDLGCCDELQSALRCPTTADALLAPLLSALVDSQRRHPLGQVPFRHHYSHGSGLVQLAASGRATVSLVFYEAVSSKDQADTIAFADGERHELCLAGAASGHLFALEKQADGAARIASEPLDLRRGVALKLGGDRTKRLERIAGRLVILRLAREAVYPRPSHEYRIADGALIHRASGDREESREEIAIALLARMGRQDAAPVLARITRSERSDHLRWQALRAALTLDTACGFAQLSAIAEDRGDALREPARLLRDHLLASHPQLARLEARSDPGLCPA